MGQIFETLHWIADILEKMVNLFFLHLAIFLDFLALCGKSKQFNSIS